jgi:hypothetical protein
MPRAKSAVTNAVPERDRSAPPRPKATDPIVDLHGMTTTSAGGIAAFDG